MGNRLTSAQPVIEIDLVIDPGTSATGWIAWVDGWPRLWGTIYPKGATPEMKRESLAKQFDALVDLWAQDGGVIRTIVIEQFEPSFHAKHKKDGAVDERYGERTALESMGKCEATRGFIHHWALTKTQDVRFASKGKVIKQHSLIRWNAMKLGGRKPSEHVIDALEISVAAGLDRRRHGM